jgi:hypothetical protein
MLDSAIISSRVPVEFIGAARVFRNQVAAEDRAVAMVPAPRETAVRASWPAV